VCVVGQWLRAVQPFDDDSWKMNTRIKNDDEGDDEMMMIEFL